MTIREVTQVACELLTRHGLHNQGWYFTLNTNKRRRGVCRWRQKSIELSEHLLALGDAEVMNTLLHEIAHALAGPEHMHNDVWRRQARAIGCTGDRCGISMGVAQKFVGTCPVCAKETPAHRRGRLACKQCCKRFNGGKFSERYLFSWREA